jgi:hypothetical protein
MSEKELYYSGSKTSKPSNLKPALSAALASLEVQLDEELARYRRTRIAHRTPIQKSLGSLIAAKGQAQNSITIANNQNQQSLTGEQAAAYIRQQQSSNLPDQTKIKTPPPPPSVPKTSPGVTEPKETNSQIRQQKYFDREQTVEFPETTTVAQSENTPPLHESSIVKADINLNTDDENISTPNNQTTKQPDDYLESSEALLRSLAEESQPPFKKPKENNDSLLSPLSIGSMLLLLVSSITFGYILFNFNNLPDFNFAGLFKPAGEVQSSENTETVSNVEPDELKPIPKNPNLSKDELPDINSIDDVAGATPTAKSTQAAKPLNPVTSPAPVEPVPPIAANTPEEQPVSETQTTPTPQNLDEIEPSNNGFYNVIVDNTGDTLTKVKQVIPDAYLSPEGKYVYLGAFKSKERVKKHLELLKENGITARVEEPN